MAAKVAGEPIEGLTINPKKAVFMIEKARKSTLGSSSRRAGSNAADDKMIGVLEDHSDDPARAELAALVGSLNVDEQIDPVALLWMGRDDYEATTGTIAGAGRAAHNSHTGRYLAGTPLGPSQVGLDVLGPSPNSNLSRSNIRRRGKDGSASSPATGICRRSIDARLDGGEKLLGPGAIDEERQGAENSADAQMVVIRGAQPVISVPVEAEHPFGGATKVLLR